MGLNPMIYRRLLGEGRVSDLNRVMAGEVDIDEVTGKLIPIVETPSVIVPIKPIQSKILYSIDELKALKHSKQISMLKALDVKDIPNKSSEIVTLLFNLGAWKGL